MLTFQSSAWVFPFCISLSFLPGVHATTWWVGTGQHSGLKLDGLFFFLSYVFMTICSHWESKESEDIDWVSGKLALPLLASAFAYVDLRELWDCSVSIAALGFKPRKGLWSKKQESRYILFPSFPNSVWTDWKTHLIGTGTDAVSSKFKSEGRVLYVTLYDRTHPGQVCVIFLDLWQWQ